MKSSILKICPLFIGLAVSIYSQSRAFSIGFIVAIIGIYLLATKKVVSKRGYFLTFMIVLILLFCSIIFIKSESSLGRIFIYKISASIYKDNWLYGVGLGDFSRIYMYHQAEYFKQGNYTQTEFLLADNTYFAFNDYFQFIIETGLFGIVVLLSFLIGLYKIVKIAISKNDSPILLNATGFLITICIAACFNYVFYKFEFQLLALICFMIIIYFFLVKNNLKTKAISLIIILSNIGLYLVFKNFNHNVILGKLKNVKEIERAGYRNEAMIQANFLAKDLAEHHDYLEVSSFIFTNAMMLKDAERETKKLIAIRPSSDAYSRLAHIYELQDRPSDAENAYLIAINMVPNRFIPRYHLFKLFRNNNKYEEARDCGMKILSMPIKIPSIIIDRIKSEIRTSIN